MMLGSNEEVELPPQTTESGNIMVFRGRQSQATLPTVSGAGTSFSEPLAEALLSAPIRGEADLSGLADALRAWITSERTASEELRKDIRALRSRLGK